MTPEEQAKEKQYNDLSASVIGVTGVWGQFYGLMKTASSTGQGMIPHKVCRDKDGGEIKVYDTKLNKFIGSFLTPTHEYVTKYISQGKYGEALAASFGMFGQGKNVKAQEEADCTEVIPDEIIAAHDKIEKQKTSKVSSLKTKIISNTQFVKNPVFWIVVTGSLLVAGISILAIKKLKN